MSRCAVIFTLPTTLRAIYRGKKSIKILQQGVPGN